MTIKWNLHCLKKKWNLHPFYRVLPKSWSSQIKFWPNGDNFKFWQIHKSSKVELTQAKLSSKNST